MHAVSTAAKDVGIASACAALGVARSSYHRWRKPPGAPPKPRRSGRELSQAERDAVLAELNSERFVDHAPVEVYATLLDEKRYLCSPSTMYRILRSKAEIGERRAQRRHVVYAAPELLATAPNQLWSWDITRLKGPAKWTYFQLYVILDVFSRMIVGWMIAHRESAILAERLIAQTCERQGILRDTLTLHADRGSSMTSKTVALLLSDLGVIKTHSRPHVSDDNPYSEANFKTLKYRPDFPERFGCLVDARTHVGSFVDWYNHEHRHGGIAHLTPHDVHYGRAEERLKARDSVLAAAYHDHPNRFVHGQPSAKQLPTAVWINPPKDAAPASESGRLDSEKCTK